MVAKRKSVRRERSNRGFPLGLLLPGDGVAGSSYTSDYSAGVGTQGDSHLYWSISEGTKRAYDVLIAYNSEVNKRLSSSKVD